MTGVWDMAPRNLVEIYRRFNETTRHYIPDTDHSADVKNGYKLFLSSLLALAWR